MNNIIVSMPMTADEARLCVDSINHQLGNARAQLLDLYERRGWEALGYANWRDCVTSEFMQSQAYLYRLLKAAQLEREISPIGEIGVIPESQLRPLTELEPEAQRIVWEVVQQTAPNGKITAGHVKSVANVFKEVVTTGALDDGSGEQVKVADVVKAAVTEETYERMMRQQEYVRENTRREHSLTVMNTSENNEWYTPLTYIEAARELMGEIDLDPASSEIANRTVKAKHIYTIDDNGLNQRWYGRVWLNPPYGYSEQNSESNQALWTGELINAYHNGHIDEAVLLVNAVTDRQWFQPLWNYPICFTDHRIRFLKPTGTPGSPTMGSVLVYFGTKTARFADIFSAFGAVVMGVIRRDGVA